jgi:hypothetical protein
MGEITNEKGICAVPAQRLHKGMKQVSITKKNKKK